MLRTKALTTICKYGMFDAGDTVLVAVSGGFDSTALLLILHSLKDELKLKLHVAHLNHMIRGREASGDAKFVKNLCRKLDIPITVGSLDIPKYASENSLGIEEAARNVRYTFFNDVAEKVKASKIAVAHNSDDNIETFLMRLIRGAGMRGLEAILPVRDNIVRPLIESSRKEIEAYLKERKIKPRMDKSNFDTNYTRNSIRHKLIPLLEKYNPNLREAISRTISSVSVDNDLIMTEVIKAKDIVRTTEDVAEVDAEGLLRLHPAVAARIIMFAIEAVKGDLTDISYVHVDDVMGISLKKRAELHLPGLFVNIDKGTLRFSSFKRDVASVPSFSYRITVPGRLEVKESGLIIEAESLKGINEKEIKKNDPMVAYIDADKISGKLLVRGRRDGDIFKPLGMKGSKKLQDIFVDEKIDLDERGKVPLIEDDEKIIWVVGFRINDDVKVTSSTKKILKMTASAI
jgi:tRNA(Ile)-lysidine synthase